MTPKVRWLTLLLAAHLAVSPLLRAAGNTDRRIEAGLKLFRSLLAADMNLKTKADPEGRLLVVFFFTDDRKGADELSGRLGRLELPTLAETTSDPTFSGYENRRPAGIFLTQAPDARSLAEIVRFGIRHSIIVYSPFEGHVESGVLAGLSIEAQVRPYLNLTTLKASNISVKEFFLKVAKVYR